MKSDLWKSRTEHAALCIARGDVYLGLLAVSACLFLLNYSLYLTRRLWKKSENDDEKTPVFSQFYTPVAYNVAQIVFCTLGDLPGVAQLKVVYSAM